MEGVGRIVTVLACSMIEMLLLCIVAPLVMLLWSVLPALPFDIGSQWLALIAAAAVMLAAIPVHRMGLRRSRRDPMKRRPWCWVISFLMNSVSGGLAAAALYILLERTVEILPMLNTMLPGLAVMCAASLLVACFPDGKKPILCLAAVAAVTLIVLQFVLQGSWSAVFGLLIALFYLFALWLTASYAHRPVLRDVSFGSFGAAMLIAFVVLVVLSDGEALEGLDGLGDIGGGDAGFDPHGQVNVKRREAHHV